MQFNWIQRNNKIFNDVSVPAYDPVKEIVFRVACNRTENERALLVF